jgi:hypothetical protein
MRGTAESRKRKNPPLSHAAITRAIQLLSEPIAFGTGQGEADALISRLTPLICDRCSDDGKIPGKRERRKCRRCQGRKRGYIFGQAIFWTGWAPNEREGRIPR